MPRYTSATNYVQSGGTLPAGLASPPVTIAARFWPSKTLSGSTCLASVDSSGSASPRLMLNIDASANQTVRAIHTTDGAAQQGIATTGTKFRFEAWNSAVAVFASTASRTAYCNGSAGAADTTSCPTTTLNRFNAAFQNGATAFVGYLADVSFWSAALTDTEVQQYHMGVDPLFIRRASLVEVLRLNRLPETGVLGAQSSYTGPGTATVMYQAPTYAFAPYKRKAIGAAFAVNVDLTVIGAALNLGGGTFDLLQLTSDGDFRQDRRRRSAGAY